MEENNQICMLPYGISWYKIASDIKPEDLNNSTIASPIHALSVPMTWLT